MIKEFGTQDFFFAESTGERAGKDLFCRSDLGWQKKF